MVGITHMDVDSKSSTAPSAPWSPKRFDHVKSELTRALRRAGFHEQHILGVVPTSTEGTGLNLLGPIDARCKEWYKGKDLASCILAAKKLVRMQPLYPPDARHSPASSTCCLARPQPRILSGPGLAFGHESMRIAGIGTVVTATILRGAILQGATVLLQRSNVSRQVFSIERFHNNRAAALAGDCVGINLRRAIRPEGHKELFVVVPGANNADQAPYLGIDESQHFSANVVVSPSITAAAGHPSQVKKGRPPLLGRVYTLLTRFHVAQAQVVFVESIKTEAHAKQFSFVQTINYCLSCLLAFLICFVYATQWRLS